MSFAKLRLIVATLLFAGWLGWLGYAVYNKGTVQIVSRAQLTGASHWVLAEVSVGDDGVPKPKVVVKQVLKGEPITGEIEVRNLPSAATPLPVQAESRTPPAGVYLLPLVKVTDGLYRIAGLPRSPGYEPQNPERPVIYPWTEDVKKQIENWK
jgi:hypothetical protein